MFITKMPYASFNEYPPTVEFDDEQLDSTVAAELFGVIALHLHNAGVHRDEVVYVGQLLPEEEAIGFRLEPDSDATRRHGRSMVKAYNLRVEQTSRYDTDFSTGLGGTLIRLAQSRVQPEA